jgi:hypothetical protein
MTFPKNRHQWKQDLLIDEHVDFTLLSESLSKALSSEARIISAGKITEVFMSQLSNQDIRWLVIADGKILFGVPLIHQRYDQWVAAVGRAIGLECDEEDFADGWLTESMRKSQAILWGLTDLTTEFMANNAQKRREQRKGPYTDALVRSVLSGESQEQSKIRLQHKKHGLKVVRY